MRTTLEIDDGVLAAAKAIAHDERVSLGTVISRLARRGLASGRPVDRTSGFPIFANSDEGGAPITLDLVNAHRDDG